MSSSVQLILQNLASLRERLSRMSDDQLVLYCKAAKYMSTPQANRGESPLPDYIIQLDECCAEWRRRHPK